MPGGFHEHPSQVRVPGFGDRASRLLRAARMLGGNQAHECHETRGRREAPGIAELRGDRERRQVINAAEAAQALNARTQRREVQQRPQIILNRAETRDGFVDRAEIRSMRLLECGEGPGLPTQPRVVPLRPRLLRRRETAAVPEQEFGEAMTRPQEIRANVFATSSAVAGPGGPVGPDPDQSRRNAAAAMSVGRTAAASSLSG